MTDEMRRLQTYLLSKYAKANVSMMTFPSGAATLDYKVDNLLLTLEYSPKEGFGISRGEKDEDAWDPEKYIVFGKNEFDEAKDCFLSLISETDL